MTHKLVSIQMDEVFPSVWNDMHRSTAKAVKTLTDSMRAIGQIVPIHVVPRKEGGYMIVDGHRRWMAAKVLKLKTIHAQIGSSDIDDATAQTIRISANIGIQCEPIV